MFGSHDNVIGGTTQRESNLISGNHDYGVHLNGQGTSGNVIRGNLIGTDITGSASLGNRLDGVHIHGGSDNFVGMLGPFGAGTRNVISGNFGDGVHLHSAGATGNVIKGNRIGTDATGNDALPNDTGVTILDVGGKHCRRLQSVLRPKPRIRQYQWHCRLRSKRDRESNQTKTSLGQMLREQDLSATYSTA